tara:strand:+ start:125 stop:289 length:165 start_codon:yes stop_codon:yes gene_type:complete
MNQKDNMHPHDDITIEEAIRKSNGKDDMMDQLLADWLDAELQEEIEDYENSRFH